MGLHGPSITSAPITNENCVHLSGLRVRRPGWRWRGAGCGRAAPRALVARRPAPACATRGRGVKNAPIRIKLSDQREAPGALEGCDTPHHASARSFPRTTIPQVACAMREIVTTVADAAARTTRCVLRRSPLGGATFRQTLVFGFLGNPEASLEELSQTAAALGVGSTPQALDQRLTEAAAACLQPVLHAARARVVAADPSAIPLLARLTAVALQDSSPIVLPDAWAPVWRGWGGTTSERTKAALQLQVRLEMRPGRLAVHRQDGRASDRAAELPGRLEVGTLRIADLGSWRLDAFRALTPQRVCWLSRLQVQSAIADATGRARPSWRG